MACALACAPLAVVQPAYACSELHVQTHLDAPLLNYVDPRELLLLASLVDAAAERAEKVYGLAFSQQERLQRLQLLCRCLKPDLKPLEALHDLGLLDYFPYLHRKLAGSSSSTPFAQHYGQEPSIVHLGAQYLTYISLLNQVVMMGTQLYHDAVVPQHHKYAAHQVALLYQSLNMLQGETKPIRRVIEARFDEIKTVTESPRPAMHPEMCTWLQRVTWVCREEVAQWPQYTWRRVQPMVALYRGRRPHSS